MSDNNENNNDIKGHGDWEKEKGLGGADTPNLIDLEAERERRGLGLGGAVPLSVEEHEALDMLDTEEAGTWDESHNVGLSDAECIGGDDEDLYNYVGFEDDYLYGDDDY